MRIELNGFVITKEKDDKGTYYSVSLNDKEIWTADTLEEAVVFCQAY